MNKLSFPITSLNRAEGAHDGSAAHMLNLRLKSGAFRPVDDALDYEYVADQRFNSSAVAIGHTPDYVHASTDGYRNLLSISDGVLRFLGQVLESHKVAAFEGEALTARSYSFDGEVRSVNHVGNTLIVLTDRGVQYFLFKPSELAYIPLGSKPPVPMVNFAFDTPTSEEVEALPRKFNADRIVDGIYMDSSGGTLTHQAFVDIADAIQDWWGDQRTHALACNHLNMAKSAAVSKAYHNLYRMGLLPDTPTIVRFALRMFDGSHTRYSPPILLNSSNGKSSYIDSLVAIDQWKHIGSKVKSIRLRGDWAVFPASKTFDARLPFTYKSAADGSEVKDADTSRAIVDGSALLQQAGVASFGLALFSRNTNDGFGSTSRCYYLMCPVDAFTTANPPAYAVVSDPVFYAPAYEGMTPGERSYQRNYWFCSSDDVSVPAHLSPSAAASRDTDFVVCDKIDASSLGYEWQGRYQNGLQAYELSCMPLYLLCGNADNIGGANGALKCLGSEGLLCLPAGFEFWCHADEWSRYVEVLQCADNPILDAVKASGKSTHFACICNLLKYRWVNAADFERWKDIITGLDIFISKPIPLQENDGLDVFPPEGIRTCNRKDLTASETPGLFGLSAVNSGEAVADITSAIGLGSLMFSEDVYNVSSDEDIRDKVRSCAQFYRLHFDDLSDLDEDVSAGRWVPLAEDISEKYASIEQQQLLLDDYGSNDSISASAAYTYNQSLHIGDIVTDRFCGYPLSVFFISNRKGFDIAVDDDRVKIHFSDTPAEAVSSSYDVIADDRLPSDFHLNSIPSVPKYARLMRGYFSPMFFYPDAKAVEAAVHKVVFDISREGDTNTYVAIAMGIDNSIRLKLSEHTALNGSFYLRDDLTPCIPPAGGYSPDATLTEPIEGDVSVRVDEPNKVMASALSNPFTFDAKRTMFVSSGRVMAFRAITAPLPTNVYGQHPLYIFCSDGIYYVTLAADGSFSTVHPVSFDVLLSSDLICNSSDTVFFACAQGVKMLRDKSTALISAPVEDSPSRADICAEALEQTDAPMALDGRYYFRLDALLQCDGVKMFYEYSNNELWIMPSENFALVYNISSKAWYHRSLKSTASLIPAYPSLMGFRSGKVVDFSAPNPDNPLPFAVVTNSFGSLTMIRPQSVAVAVDADALTHISSRLYCGPSPYILRMASKVSLADKQGFVSALHHPRIPASVRYLAVAINGLARRAAISGVTAMVNPTDQSLR